MTTEKISEKVSNGFMNMYYMESWIHEYLVTEFSNWTMYIYGWIHFWVFEWMPKAAAQVKQQKSSFNACRLH